MMLMTQYFDVLSGLGKDGQISTVFVPNSQSNGGSDLRQSLLEAGAAKSR